MVTRRTVNPDALKKVRGSPCVICGAPSDPAHIKSRGAGGHDEETNLFSLCRPHHALSHQIGWGRFVVAFPEVRTELRKKGWHVVREFGVEKLRRIDTDGVKP